MTVLPGSLNYLYHNGIVDHIPYEAYTMSPITPSGYAQMAGAAYNPYADSDSFMRDGAYPPRPQDRKFSQRIYNNEGYGRDMDMEAMINGEDGKQVRKSIFDKIQNLKDKLVNCPEWAKGIFGLGLIFLTGFGIFKGLKKPPVKK